MHERYGPNTQLSPRLERQKGCPLAQATTGRISAVSALFVIVIFVALNLRARIHIKYILDILTPFNKFAIRDLGLQSFAKSPELSLWARLSICLYSIQPGVGCPSQSGSVTLETFKL